ncbi:MAG: amidohydrolase [Clostridia bacterium]|nr:amidohydrolase [Clostridia bacterium]
METVKQLAEQIFDEIVEIRRTIHRHPELGFCEYKTSDLICSYLEKWGIPYKKGVAKTGVVGLIEVDPKAKTLLLRADMDALPVQEETDCDFKSQIDGCMHACGHDVHVAILLGVAAILMQMRDRLSCNVKLVFQPAEEGEGGAKPMIAEGVMENPHVDAAVGAHVINSVPAGKVLVKYGEVMASPDDFNMTIRGKGGHGAYPHECVDPISIGVQILNAWNALSARYTTPLEKHLISVNMFQAGTCFNVIPDDAYISGTVRTFDETVRQYLAKRMGEIAEQIAAVFGAECEFNFNYLYPPLLNDQAMTDAVRKSAEAILGKENVLEGVAPSMGGEDFAYFSKEVPATYIYYGSGNEKIGAVMPWHNAAFTIDEQCIKTGMIVMCQAALDFGEK